MIIDELEVRAVRDRRVHGLQHQRQQVPFGHQDRLPPPAHLRTGDLDPRRVRQGQVEIAMAVIENPPTNPTYADLLLRLQPRSIKSEEEAERIRSEVQALLDRGELTEDEWELLTLLGDILSVWEAGRYPREPIPIPDKIRALLEAQGLQQKDLVGPVFSTQTVASDVLNGRRKLSYAMVERLADFFHVSPALFFPPTRLN